MKNNNKLIRFVQSFIIIPIVTMPMSIGALPQTGAGIVSAIQLVSSRENISAEALAFNNSQEEAVKVLEARLNSARQAKAAAVNAYFEERDMPLEGMGMKMVVEAEKNNLDWRLVAAIAVRESTGGKFDCIKVNNNPFGWASCKVGFESNEHAIEIVAQNLGGNNPKTARYYDNKTTLQILRAYNPPSIVPRYAEQVISIMNTIGEINLGEPIVIVKADA